MRLCLQIGVLSSEKEVLEEAASKANAKVREIREAMAGQNKQLGQLQVLPPRLQDMQEQVISPGIRQSPLHAIMACSNENHLARLLVCTVVVFLL